MFPLISSLTPQHLLAIPLILATTCLVTWLTTTIQFQRTVSRIKSRTSNPKPIAPPLLPYAIPWLGSALSFLNENPGSFWKMLRSKLYDTGADIPICTILLGGKRAHVISSASAVQALFRSKSVSREFFNHQLATQGLGTSKYDAEAMFPSTVTAQKYREMYHGVKKDSMEALNHEFLLSQSAVNSLTRGFMERFQQALDQADIDHEWKTIDLLAWVRKIMFDASTTAVMGSTILEQVPDLAELFSKYELGFLARFYGVPRFVKPEAYSSLDSLLEKTEKWLESGLRHYDNNLPEEPDWEPYFGSKVIRARHRLYKKIGLTSRGRAAFDLGFLFGLQSNAIPVTCWLLAHLLSPTTPDDVPGRIYREIKTARSPTGEIDLSLLSSQPLLNSALHETMRLYVDSLVTRQLNQDMVLDGYLLKKNDLVMAPSSLSQQDPIFWQHDAPPADSWYAERFLKHDDETGRDTFTTSWASGKFFPFGGGTHVCPGRVFAKQEILGALASILQRFDINFVEYVGTDRSGNSIGLGEATSGFPKIKRQYAGNGTLSMDGDVRVQIRRK